MSASRILVWIVQNDYERILNCKWPNSITGTGYGLVAVNVEHSV